MGVTVASTLSTSTAARGSTSRGSASDPRRSRRRITRSSLGIDDARRAHPGCVRGRPIGHAGGRERAGGWGRGRSSPCSRSGTVLVPGLRAAPAHLRAALPAAARRPARPVPRATAASASSPSARAARSGADGVTAMYEVGTLALAARRSTATPTAAPTSSPTATRASACTGSSTRVRRTSPAEVEWLGEDGRATATPRRSWPSRCTASSTSTAPRSRAPGRSRRPRCSSCPHDPRVLSYLVAAAMVLDLRDRQLAARGGDHARPAAPSRAPLLVARDRDAARAPSLPAVDLARTPIGVN